MAQLITGFIKTVWASYDPYGQYALAGKADYAFGRKLVGA